MTKGSNYLTSMRCKLRGSVVSVVVMEGNGDTYVLQWDYLSNARSIRQIKHQTSEKEEK